MRPAFRALRFTPTNFHFNSYRSFVMAGKWPELSNVEKLSERVIRILGQNPGKFTLQGSNTYLIGNGRSRLLIDTGEGRPEWLQLVKSTLERENAVVEKVLVTHWHGDHVGGVKDVQTLVPQPAVHKNQPMRNWTNIEDGEQFQVEGATLRAFHTPGHTQDHMAFVLEEEDALFTGDNVLGHGTSVFEDLPVYISSLERMAAAASGRAYPGHGAVIEDSKAKINEYITHRAQREKEVVQVLVQHQEGQGLSVMDLVKVIYKDTPENLHFAASRGVVQILEKLSQDGRINHNEGENTWSLAEKAVL